MTLEQFAEGIVRVVNANMERALRVVSVERGYDPRQFALVAFGGAGGLHACELAQELGIPRVIVPPFAGALSAYGILASDIVKDYSRTVMASLGGKSSLPALGRRFEALERCAAREFREEGWTGKPRFERSADVRYRGQGFELNVAFSNSLVDDFHRQHQFRYGYNHPEREVELVTLRLRARLKTPRVPIAAPKAERGAARVEKRPVWFDGKLVRTALYRREDLAAGRKLRGPAVIVDYGATTVIPPGVRFAVDRAGNLVMDVVTRCSA